MKRHAEFAVFLLNGPLVKQGKNCEAHGGGFKRLPRSRCPGHHRFTTHARERGTTALAQGNRVEGCADVMRC